MKMKIQPKSINYFGFFFNVMIEINQTQPLLV